MAHFVPHTKSGSANLPEGVVHVFREASKPEDLDSLTSAASTREGPEDITDDRNGVVLGVLAVPSWMTPSDFLTFVAPAAEGMSHLRMIRYEISSFL